MVPKVVIGSRYLGGFIKEIEAEKSWLAGKVEGWEDFAETLTEVSHKNPQSEYEELQKSLQQEWAIVQQVTPGIYNNFGPVEKALQETFLPELFERIGEGAPERGVTCQPVKQAGLALPDPTLIAPENWTVSCVVT